jgi:hypothetical protein
MKLKKVFGSEAVQELIREAQEVAATLPGETVRDPWQDDRILVDPTYGKDTSESKQQDQ